MRLRTFLIAALVAMTAPALAQTAAAVNAHLDSIFGEHGKFEQAFSALQAAVSSGDAKAVAVLAAYPLVVKVDGRREVGSEEEFTRLYDEIVTEEIVAAVSGQSYESLFASDQGIMFGNGQVWMSGVCEDDACEQWDVKIITIQSTAQ
mgnify:FL=1